MAVTAVVVCGNDWFTIDNITRAGREASVGVITIAGIAVGLKLVIVAKRS